jgi:hypothetical protein
VNTAQIIASTLDRHLQESTEVIVFGSAALLLDPEFAPQLGGRMTNDIDVIVPAGRELMIDADTQFWAAIEATNRELASRGLYITHIFPEREVVLTPEWKQHLVTLPNPALNRLRLFRPRILDLIVSKMGRGDLQDQADVRSMLTAQRAIGQPAPSTTEVADAAGRAVVPEVYRGLFPAAAAQVLSCIRHAGAG